jgi:hypothetical protein
MTILETTFHYGLQPDERALQALGRVRQVYGVRKTWLNERVKTIRVEYDASRLGEHDVAALLRAAGLMFIELAAPLRSHTLLDIRYAETGASVAQPAPPGVRGSCRLPK